MSGNDPVLWRLHLLGCWQLERDQQPVTVTYRQQRLIAALALRGARRRTYFAGLLWPDRTDEHASGSLRACLWHISHQLPGLIRSGRDPLMLSGGVHTDVDELSRWMDAVNSGRLTSPPAGMIDQVRHAELLTGWYEEWLIPDQDRMTWQRMVTLENLANQYLSAGELDVALDAATAASVLDPLRESTQRTLLRIHLAGGNHGPALRSYQNYVATLWRECGATPSRDILELVRPIIDGAGRPQFGESIGFDVGLRPSFE
ncbi:AfsR/SARP family transcriptional regulator [Arthrobacter castelli]|uniref:AfsR/SARP family transcriptional regulator n=1 Tax=Arthrobacter castelli TaxID=271431 RepID=UPI000684B08C|nr:BTAD domain-containing putative transcriptional regulator [Arthrobacter castelli]